VTTTPGGAILARREHVVQLVYGKIRVVSGYDNNSMRRYIAEYRAKRRWWAINRLGGSCVRCESTSKLEFDHIDPSTKVDSVSNMLTAAWVSFETEVAKCQLLCTPCHFDKSRQEGSFNRRPVTHGVTSTYDRHRCRCEPCREAKRRSRLKTRIKQGRNAPGGAP
jgi:hypothetical protein